MFTAALAGIGCAYYGLEESADAVTYSLICLAIISMAATKAVGTKAFKTIKPPRSSAPERTSGVMTRDAFVAFGDRMIRQSRKHRQPLSVLVLELHDLPELKELFGAETASQLVRKLLSSLHTLAPARSVVVRSEAEVFTVFLPGLKENAARDAVTRTFGHTISVEIDAQEQEIVLVPDFRIHSLSLEVTSFYGWYEEAICDFKFARALEARRQRHLRLERESHSTRPAPLTEVRPVPFALVRHEQTMPMNIGVR